ncbi:MAG: 50S ribosomal protein L25 [Candidatus Binatia bacterium]|nr:MAG: 50S ribosomal protein L25 [Candidatus Binatia bacterium]
MEAVEVQVDRREKTGKSEARRLRRAGRVPAVFYGPKTPAVPISADRSELLLKVLRLEGAHLLRFRSAHPELDGRVALLTDRQTHPVTGELLHADFYEVDLTVKIEAMVPLHFVGRPVGVVRDGGILQPVRREVEVFCLPMDIPEYIEVDVSGLGIHESLHVADLKLPPGVEVRADTNFTIVTVLPPTVEEVKVEEVPEVAEAEVGVAGAEEKAPEEKPEASEG